MRYVVDVELSGGPMDGWRGPLTNRYANEPLRGVEFIKGSQPDPDGPCLGHYMLTDRKTPDGRLIYEFRGPISPPSSSPA